MMKVILYVLLVFLSIATELSTAFIANTSNNKNNNNINIDRINIATSTTSLILRYATTPQQNNNENEYSESEIEEMKELILSLSLEPTDDSRRQRVIKVFDEALSRPNGMPKKFADLFDQTLIQVGEEVQYKAKKEFFEAQAAAEAEKDSSTLEEEEEEDDDEFEEEPKERVKTPGELQLWALVDMMVQTKTIVKRENGELGSEGVFQ